MAASESNEVRNAILARFWLIQPTMRILHPGVGQGPVCVPKVWDEQKGKKEAKRGKKGSDPFYIPVL
jgi:hypothetical protein